MSQMANSIKFVSLNLHATINSDEWEALGEGGLSHQSKADFDGSQ